jgi:hypothetical protein
MIKHFMILSNNNIDGKHRFGIHPFLTLDEVEISKSSLIQQKNIIFNKTASILIFHTKIGVNKQSSS